MHCMNVINIFQKRIIGLVLGFFITASVFAQDKANILFVFADQMRNHAVAINGEDPTITPNLDNLAQEGVLFNNAISTSPVCTPYRGMLISGQHPLTTGISVNCSPANPDMFLRPDENAFGNIFKANGYQTGYIGKWHLDDPQTAIPLLGYSPDGTRGWDTYTPPGPKRQGFDFWHAYNAYDQHMDPHYWEDSEELIEPGIWSVEHETDVAIDYIENRDSEKPFLLLVSYLPPHGPFSEVPEKYKEYYKDIDPTNLLNRENVVLTGEGAKAEVSVNDYFAAVTGIDEQVGRLISYLKSENLYDNTIIIFTADHGEMMGSQGRMHKSKWYEEAINVPLIVSYPPKMPSGTNDCLVGPADYIPTLLSLSGHDVPQGYYGKDLSEAFKGDVNQDQDTIVLGSYGGNKYTDDDNLWMSKGWRGVRTKTHTFVVRLVFGVRTYELYDNVNDKWQLNQVVSTDIAQNPEMLPYYEYLKKHLDKYEDLFLEHPGAENNPYSLLDNSGFELGTLEGWNTWNNGITDNADNVHEGLWAGWLKNGKDGSLQQKLNLKSNTQYRFSLWMKVNADGEFAKMIIKDHGFPKVANSVGSTDYEQYSHTFTTGEVNGEVTLSLYKATKDFGNMYADNFELIEIGDDVTEIQLSIDENNALYENGDDVLVNAFVIPVTAEDKELQWSVENVSGEALVDGEGFVTPIKQGIVKVIASSFSNPSVSGSLELEIRKAQRLSYYIDSESGSDDNDGLSVDSPWKSLQKVNETAFFPGDSILFKSGSFWEGQLEIECTGTESKPIVFSAYGSDSKPAIHGQGEKDYSIQLLNSSHTIVSGFEVTNLGDEFKGGRYGVKMLASNQGSIYSTILRDLDVHDVNGDRVKNNGGGGGIIWRTEGSTPSRFVDAVIEDCHVYDCERNGIKGSTQYYPAEYQGKMEYYNLGFKIRRNLVERIPGDGIIILGCYGAVAEYNVCRDFTEDLPVGDAAAGIWPWNSIKTVIQHNEVSGHMAGWDGQGFDSDYNCDSTIIQYNYSHDNAGGFILICSNPQWQGYNNNSIVRYNISVNDGFRTWGNGADFCPNIHLAGNIYNTRIYNNTFYIEPKPASVKKEFIEATKWNGGWPDLTFIENNLFIATEPTTFTFANSSNNSLSHNFYSTYVELPADNSPFVGDPLFVDPGESDDVNNYKLGTGSPAGMKGKIIQDNGGFDYFGNSVSAVDAPNIGAYNGNLLNTENPGGQTAVNELISLFPNPTMDSSISIQIMKDQLNAELILMTLNGEVIGQNFYSKLGKGVLKWNVAGCHPGAYLVVLKTKDQSQSKKFIIR